MSDRFEYEKFVAGVKNHFEANIEDIIDEEIKQACLNVTRRIRDKTGSIAARILNNFDFAQDRNRIIITVNFNNLEKGLGNESDDRN